MGEEKEKIVYENVCKYVYQTECKIVKVPYTDYVTECEEGYEDKCVEQWVCRDDPKPESLKYCKNKQWEATDECVKIKVDHCKDVQKTFHKYEEKCDTKKVEKCEDVQKTIYEPIHKRVPTQIKEKLPSGSVMENLTMNTHRKKSGLLISQNTKASSCCAH